MNIKSINYNWYFSQQNGEEFTNRTVGIIYNGWICEKITEHQVEGPGDKWYYDIIYGGAGGTERIFNPNQVFYK